MKPGHIVIDFEGHRLTTEDKALLVHPQVGGVILFARNYADSFQLQYLVQEIKALRSNLLIMADQEGGRVQRFREGFTALPAFRSFGDIYNTDEQKSKELLRYYTRTMVSELQAAGLNCCLSPVLDLDYEMSEVIGSRSLHSDPNIVTELGRVVIDTMHELNMPVVAKHFPGHGAVAADSHKELPVDPRSFQIFRENDLVPFCNLLQSVDAIMPGHLLIPMVDAELPTSLSRVWLTDILRTELRFQGSIISDDLTMGALSQFGGYTDRAQLALEAGCDLLLICNNRQGVEEVLDGVEQYHNPISQARVQSLINRTM